MRQQDHLQFYDLCIRVQSPLFIGSGVTYLSKQYNCNPDKSISIYDEQKFSAFLVQHGVMERYIDFVLHEKDADMYQFLTKECGLKKEWRDLREAERYRINAANVLDDKGKLCEIHAFQRDARNQPYVPGSSIKGALRTAWLAHQVLEEDAALHSTDDLWDADKRPAFPESRYLNLLTLSGQKEDSVNDLFRGIQVSDSRPIASDDQKSKMILCSKYDFDPNGRMNFIPVWRECIAAGTGLVCRLTLDQSVLKGHITKELLTDAIRQYSAYYRTFFAKHFTQPQDAAGLPESPCLILGGGSGFLAKTLVYPYLGEEAGLNWTIDRLNEKAPAHHHQEDHTLGAAPRMMKYAFYKNKYYPYGFCEVNIV